MTGRASTTKPTRTAPATAADSRGSARSRRRPASTAPVKIARLAPDTASRWVSPAARKSSSTSGRERAGVADGQAGQEPGLGGRERARRGAQARPQPTRRGLPPGRGVDLARCAPHPQHRDGEVGPLGRSQQAFGRDALAGQQPAPALGGREQQHPAAAVPTPRACGGRHQLGGHDHPRCGRAPGGPEVRSARGSSRRTTRRVAAAPRSACSCRGCAVTSRVWAAMTIPAAAAVPAAASRTGDRRPRRARRARRRRTRPARTGHRARAPKPSSITAQAAAAAGTSRRSTGGRSVGVRIRPSPDRGAAGTGVHRCRRSPAADPPGRSGRCGCATPRCAGR